MQIVLMAILTVALSATAVSFVVMGIRQKRHTRHLARQADEQGLHFSSDDPFDIPERYRRFTLLSCGHSPRARNVTHGRINALPLRAFEFRYEIGHGTRRTTCRYSAVIVDVQNEAEALTMWNHSDAEQAPLESRRVHGETGCWSYCGSARLAERLSHAAGALALEGLSLQVQGSEVLLCLPATRPRERDYFTWLRQAASLADLIVRPEESPERELGS